MKLVALAAALFTFFVLAGCGDSDSKTENLTFITGKAQRSTEDNGSKGTGPGDLYTYASPLFEEGSDNEVGSMEGFAITTPGDAQGDEAERRGSLAQLNLEKGSLVTGGVYEVGRPGGPVPDDDGVVRAILGGTGDYKSAGGTATLTPDQNGRIKVELEVELDDD